MEVINNLGVLDELDNETAVTIIQLALQELGELFEHDQGSNQRPEGTQSEARRRLERQSDELRRQLRRRQKGARTTGGPSSSTASRPRQEPTETRPARSQQVQGQQLGVPSSSSAVLGRRQQSSRSARRAPGAQSPPPYTGPRLSCNVCMEVFPERDMVTFACNHHCCRECLNEIYRGATTDEARYPPRCCQPIPIDQSRPLLNARVLRDFLDKQVEWETRDRTYCSNKNCSYFIRPESIRGRDISCPRCRTRTCPNCKQAAHGANRPCADDQGIRDALRVMEQNLWRRCEGCRNGIERIFGCNHMVCVCGRQFCYQCGAQWKTCTCPWFPNEMAIAGFNPIQRPNLDNYRVGGGLARGARLDAAPNPENRAIAGFNPIQRHNLANHTVEGGLARRPFSWEALNIENHRVGRDLGQFGIEPPGNETAPAPMQELPETSNGLGSELREEIKRLGERIDRLGCPFNDSDTDSTS